MWGFDGGIAAWNHLCNNINQGLKDSSSQNRAHESNQGLLIIEWAMKFLPLQYTETQSEVFEKRALAGTKEICMKTDNAGYYLSVVSSVLFYYLEF